MDKNIKLSQYILQAIQASEVCFTGSCNGVINGDGTINVTRQNGNSVNAIAANITGSGDCSVFKVQDEYYAFSASNRQILSETTVINRKSRNSVTTTYKPMFLLQTRNFIDSASITFTGNSSGNPQVFINPKTSFYFGKEAQTIKVYYQGDYDTSIGTELPFSANIGGNTINQLSGTFDLEYDGTPITISGTAIRPFDGGFQVRFVYNTYFYLLGQNNNISKVNYNSLFSSITVPPEDINQPLVYNINNFPTGGTINPYLSIVNNNLLLTIKESAFQSLPARITIIYLDKTTFSEIGREVFVDPDPVTSKYDDWRKSLTQTFSDNPPADTDININYYRGIKECNLDKNKKTIASTFDSFPDISNYFYNQLVVSKKMLLASGIYSSNKVFDTETGQKSYIIFSLSTESNNFLEQEAYFAGFLPYL